jgi:hypothetical protein
MIETRENNSIFTKLECETGRKWQILNKARDNASKTRDKIIKQLIVTLSQFCPSDMSSNQ